MHSQQPSNPYEEAVVTIFDKQISQLIKLTAGIGINLDNLRQVINFKNLHQNDFTALRIAVAVIATILQNPKLQEREDIALLAQQIQAKAIILAEVIENSHYLEQGMLTPKDANAYLDKLEQYSKSFREGSVMSNFVKHEHNHALENIAANQPVAPPRKDSLKRSPPPIPPRPVKRVAKQTDPKFIVTIPELDKFTKLEQRLYSHMPKSWRESDKLVKKTKVEDPKFIAYRELLIKLAQTKREVKEGKLSTEQAFGKNGVIRSYIDDLIKQSDMKMSVPATFFGKTSKVATGLRKFLEELDNYHPSQRFGAGQNKGR